MNRLAYYFDYDYADNRNVDTYLAPLSRAVGAWARAQQSAQRPRLDAEIGDERVDIVDTRPIAVAQVHHLTGVAARIYQLCDTARTVPALLRDAELAGDEAGIRMALDQMVADRLMLAIQGRHQSLAVFRNRQPAENARHATTAAA